MASSTGYQAHMAFRLPRLVLAGTVTEISDQ